MADKAAARLIDAWGTRDPFALCEFLGITVVTLPLPESTRGLYYRTAGQRIILLSRSLSRPESRAVCAHELGHALLHPQVNVHYMRNHTHLVTQKLEREAERFAAALLIDPAQLADPQYRGYTAQQLAAALEVPDRLLESLRRTS